MTQAPTDPQPAPQEPGLDAAQQSLSDALRVSFSVLKVLMLVLGVVYICSGVFRVDEQNTAVRYRFGEEVGTYGPGWHFGLPFPIEEVVMVPRNPQTVRLDKSFWYDNPEDQAPEQLAFQRLDPLKDSFLITGDTNVIHVQFEVNYIIQEADVDKYLRNVGSLERADELVRTAAERGMIHAIASAKVDDIVSSSKYPIEAIEQKTRDVLAELGTGITVQQVLIDLKNQSMPNQVREAYNGVTQAQADKVKKIQDARRTFAETLGGTAGGAHTELLVMVRAYEAALGNEQTDLAEALRGRLDRAIRELRLPAPSLLGLVNAYQDATAAAAGSSDAGTIARAAQASAALLTALQTDPGDQPSGAPIAGQIAAAISKAKANRSQITTQARLDYERYASALDAYREAPLVLANDRLQATREKVMTGMTLSFFGDVTRYTAGFDPEDVNAIAEKELADRRERARQQAEEERE